ncbi:hypothetical protein P9239_00405 [Caballeronia sp. LZ062]|uniref:hypothetical protein n=1 Tax=unclassified Caballeronia TaxID=2646786 RepID=UPI00286482C7|nr:MULTISPECIES: hypothetical protein [unclassified Caballeronia]MDR5857266.1 hypothetical protein [Caballeronia sp. LZ050]MDR5868817.1 hypothetical protein [Caballeronia sp. LZ062]
MNNVQTPDGKAGEYHAEVTRKCAIEVRADTSAKWRAGPAGRAKTHVGPFFARIESLDTEAGRNFALAASGHRETFSTGARAAKNTVRPEFPLRFSVNLHASRATVGREK